MRRKKSLVRPDRERIDPNHRLWHYREHAVAAAEAMPQQQGGRPGMPQQGYSSQTSQRAGGVSVLPSTTGNAPPGLRRGKSILAREPTDGASESGLNFLKRGATLRRKTTAASKEGLVGGRQGPTATSAGTGRSATRDYSRNKDDEGVACLGNFVPGPKNWWMVYCYLLTICIPNFVLKNVGGKRTPEAQRAWREKIGLVSINAFLMAAVGFITFGFTQTVCSSTGVRIQGGTASNASLIINGYSYDLGNWNHPAAGTAFNGSQNPLFMDNWMAGGKDASFLFQKVNENCLNILTPSNTTAIPKDGNRMAWYFPCNLHDQDGKSAVNLTGYTDATNCHTSTSARNDFYAMNKQGEIYWSWDQVQNSSRNLAVYESSVLDLSLLQWLQNSQVSYPAFFDEIKTANASYQGKDITMMMYRAGMKDMGRCLEDIARVGFVDTKSIGCVASDVVLYVSLVFILGVVGIKFAMAVIFGWFLSWKLGNFKGESYQQRMARAQEIENWTEDIYRPAPSRYRPSVPQNKGGNGQQGRKAAFLPTTSRFSKAEPMMVNGSRPSTAYGNVDQLAYGGGYGARSRQASMYGMNKVAAAVAAQGTPPGSPMLRSSRSSTSLPYGRDDSRMNLASDANVSPCPFPLVDVIPQPPPDYEPFNFPLMHTICLVTAYSESIEGLRTTLDSLATTDYPNSHKMILVIADGMVTGAGSKQTTPDIVLGMMKDLIIPTEQVEPHSYVAIADGHKRHNMAKVYAGYYEYDNNTVELSKQQKVPIVLVAKCGNPLEVNDVKPGNRGKRDSQIVLMAFLQKVMFDERMTTFEYEFFNSIWRVTGVSPDRYESVLCVDADTKVFPDSLTRMVACLVHDQEIMGLCGETKIANKAETWVTMIQGEYCVPLDVHALTSRSFRILHLSSLDQGFRVHVWWCHLSSRLFLHVPNQGAQGRNRLLGPYPRQSRHCGTLFGKHCRHAAQEEPVAARRRSIPDDAHAQDIPQAKDDVLPSSRMQDGRTRHFPSLALSTTTLDQLDHSQLGRARARSGSLRYILLFDAVCRLYGTCRNARLAGRHRIHLVHYHSRYYPGIIETSRLVDPARLHSRSSRSSYRHYVKKSCLCRLDVDLSLFASDLELCPTCIRFLAHG